MPPRRSTARTPSATPVRGSTPLKPPNRASSALPPESVITRRVTRRSSQEPGDLNNVVDNPQLPEVQTQQSYAYGSTKTPALPEQLVARERMTLRQMADTIDSGVQQAQLHLRDHIADTEAHLQVDAGNAQARRRTSKEPREVSVDSGNLQNRKHQRVAAWADQLDNQLEEIQEELSSAEEIEEPATDEEEDDKTRKGTDPSSFPEGDFDHTYNYERGMRQPRTEPGKDMTTLVRTIVNWSKESSVAVRKVVKTWFAALDSWMRRLLSSVTRAIVDLPDSSLITVLTKGLIALCIMGLASWLFCSLYTSFLCDPYSTTPIAGHLQKFCGSCAANPYPSLNASSSLGPDTRQYSQTLKSLNEQYRRLESKLEGQVGQRYSSIEAEMKSLQRQHNDLVSQIARLGDQRSGSSEGTPSPLIAKVNFFAPNNGAVIDPRRTSPTRAKPVNFVARVGMRMLSMTRYQSNPPMTALEAWQDVGDCWCSSEVPRDSEESLRLAVTVQEWIYPTEMVIEHYPSAGTLTPETAPRQIEIWADFSHLDHEEWRSLHIRDMQDSAPLGPDFGLIGRMKYDATVGSNHLQAFKLEVNRNELKHYARHFLVRVTSNHGSAYTCLYRVRLHGVPVQARPEAQVMHEA